MKEPTITPSSNPTGDAVRALPAKQRITSLFDKGFVVTRNLPTLTLIQHPEIGGVFAVFEKLVTPSTTYSGRLSFPRGLNRERLSPALRGSLPITGEYDKANLRLRVGLLGLDSYFIESSGLADSSDYTSDEADSPVKTAPALRAAESGETSDGSVEETSPTNIGGILKLVRNYKYRDINCIETVDLTVAETTTCRFLLTLDNDTSSDDAAVDDTDADSDSYVRPTTKTFRVQRGALMTLRKRMTNELQENDGKPLSYAKWAELLQHYAHIKLESDRCESEVVRHESDDDNKHDAPKPSRCCVM